MDLNGWKKLESTKYLSFDSGGCHQGHGGNTHKFRLVSVGCRRSSNRVITTCPLSLSFLTSISMPLHKHHTKYNSSWKLAFILNNSLSKKLLFPPRNNQFSPYSTRHPVIKRFIFKSEETGQKDQWA